MRWRGAEGQMSAGTLDTLLEQVGQTLKQVVYAKSRLITYKNPFSQPVMIPQTNNDRSIDSQC